MELNPPDVQGGLSTGVAPRRGFSPPSKELARLFFSLEEGTECLPLGRGCRAKGPLSRCPVCLSPQPR